MDKIKLVKKYKFLENIRNIEELPAIISRDGLIEFWEEIRDVSFPDWFGSTPWGDVPGVAYCVYLDEPAGKYSDEEKKRVVEFYRNQR